MQFFKGTFKNYLITIKFFDVGSILPSRILIYENRVKTVNGCTKSPVSLPDERGQECFVFTFIFILNIDKPVKIVHLHLLYIIFERV